MIEGSLSRRYARALFELALEERREEQVGGEIDRYVAAYADSSLSAALTNPAFPLASRKNLPAIASCYRRLLDEKRGRVEARVVSSAPLEAAMLDRLREALSRLSGKEVVLKPESDPGLIGGVVIQLEGKVYDGSVRTQIEKMKERIERGY